MRVRLLIGTWLLLTISSYSSVRAEDGAISDAVRCRSNATEVATAGGPVRLRDFLCDGPGGLRLRIQFHRVTDTIADAMMRGTLPEGTAPILGQTEVIENPVSRKLNTLLDKFGEARRFGYFILDQFTPGSAKVSIYDPFKENGAPVIDQSETWRSLGRWESGEPNKMELPTFPSAEDISDIVDRGRLPSEYTDVRIDTAADGFRFWGAANAGFRSMLATDLIDLPAKVAAFNSTIRADDMRDANDPARSIGVADTPPTAPRQLRLFQHIANGRLPRGFSVVEATLHMEGGCAFAPGWSLSYYPRELLVEIAVIENLTSRPVTLGGFEGVVGRTERLRRSRSLGDFAALPATPLGTETHTLAPRKRIALFQRLKFIAPVQPSYTTLPIFDYGPVSFLRSFEADGVQVALNERSHNATLLTFGTEAGSCPFLMSRDDEGAWVNHGKVLHKAKGAASEQWDKRAFEGFRSKFRLTELEPERATIDAALLDLTLRSGATLTLQSKRGDLARVDGKAVRVYMHESVDITFTLPPGVEKQDVVRSTFRTFGHYDRYSDLVPLTGAVSRVPTGLFCEAPDRSRLVAARQRAIALAFAD